MQVFMSEDTRSALKAGAILGGVMLVGGQPIGDVEDTDLRFFVPKFFGDFGTGRGVLCPNVSLNGDYSVTLLTDDGDEVQATPGKGGWNLKLVDIAGEEPPVTWFESFC